MKKWHEYCNYKRIKNPDDGTTTYIIIIDGEDIEVNEEVYLVYAKYGRKMKYMELDLKRDRVLQDANGKAVLDNDGLPVMLPEREVSLDKLIDEDWDFPSPDLTPEEAYFFYEYSEKAELYRCLQMLSDDEQDCMNALFFDGITIREYAESIGKSKSSVDRYKAKIIGKLKILMENQ